VEVLVQIIRPRRASHTYRQRLGGSRAQVFPLLCPVREVDWAVGWEPSLVVSESGLVERDCVFVTPEASSDAIWYVTRHEPNDYFVEMLKITPGETACRLGIQLIERPDAPGGCFADVTYTHTSIGPKGDERVAAFTADYYRHFMEQWEKELNHYLTTGRMLPARTG
jgi:hypothetical protein